MFEADTTDESAVESEADEPFITDNDVEWTPGIHKRLKKESPALLDPKRTQTISKPKMFSAAVTCKCKSNCSTKRCVCFKADGRCSDSCKCQNTCENREMQQPESTTHDEDV